MLKSFLLGKVTRDPMYYALFALNRTVGEKNSLFQNTAKKFENISNA